MQAAVTFPAIWLESRLIRIHTSSLRPQSSARSRTLFLNALSSERENMETSITVPTEKIKNRSRRQLVYANLEMAIDDVHAESNGLAWINPYM
jgi:hypothetical protein